MPSEAAIQQVWALSLVIYLVVVVVVAVLLTLILQSARRIRQGAGEIWTVGQKVANNTIHVALLAQTNHIVNGILARAAATAEAVSAIQRHAGACPRCPDCVTGPAKRGA